MLNNKNHRIEPRIVKELKAAKNVWIIAINEHIKIE